MYAFSIVTVTADNVDDLGFFCIKSKRHPGYVAKRAWLERRFAEGLRIQLAVSAEGHTAGFLEYAPGESTWRVVDATDYLVIHCLWVASKKFPYRGMTAALLERCVDEARAAGKHGVAVVTSDGPWMAGKAVFLKHGFEEIDRAPPRFELLVKRRNDAPPPAFPENWTERLERIRGLQLLYTTQCPYIGKALEELPAVAERHGAELELVEIDDPATARATMPSPYGVIALVHDGQLLADHPISATRFQNILQRDLELKPVADH